MATKAQISKAISALKAHLENNVRPRKPALEKIAREHGFAQKIEAKELVEAALFQMGREAVKQHQNNGVKDVFDELVGIYQAQPTQRHRTSQSTILQQYSTPLPLAYLAGQYANLDQASKDNPGFDPSAGNGLLTVAADPAAMVVNELDPFRRDMLAAQNFMAVYDQDAATDFDAGPYSDYFSGRQFDFVVTNPPFDRLKEGQKAGKATFKVKDHWMAHLALEQMADDGRAAIIVGGHNRWNEKGSPQAGKNRMLLQYLYYYYHVDDIVNISGDLYARQGTAFETRLILVNGRKAQPEGTYPRYDAEREAPVASYQQLWERMCEHISPQPKSCKMPQPLTSKDPNAMPVKKAYTPYQNGPAWMRYALENGWTINDIRSYLAKKHGSSETEAQQYIEKWKELIPASFWESLKQGLVGLGRPYNPGSDGCKVLKVETPDSMAYETQLALAAVKRQVGDLDKFVQKKLGYSSNDAMCEALAAEQIDGAALAIYNIERRGEGMIIGDQTGIGKGRQAAAIIRYAHQQGKRPVFITKNNDLFSDLYRDLEDIGYSQITPFIFNASTRILDENKKVLFRTPSNAKAIIKSRKLPNEFDFVVTTYSQFQGKNPLKGYNEKQAFLDSLAPDNIFILDEAHLASGLESNTGLFMRDVLAKTKGALFLSATYAKRADSMPLYATKTSIKDTNASPAVLTEAINKGGVALQEVISAQLVQEGQMLRRQRSLDNVQPIYEVLTTKKAEHRAINDQVVKILHAIISFQKKYIMPFVEGVDKTINAEAPEDAKAAVSELGAKASPFSSRLFNLVSQLLLSIKSETIADKAIQYLREGYKPVIAVKGTMESFLADMEFDEVQNIDFSEVLKRALHLSAMSYRTTSSWGEKNKLTVQPESLSIEGQEAYYELIEMINSTSTGLTVSPLDVIIDKVEAAGYSLAEVTGRKTRLKSMGDGVGKKVRYKGRDKFKSFNDFNNNRTDALIINVSGSTGASGHAIVTDKVPKYEVKPRAMIIGEPELDVNEEVQKRGRINRTGQILDPVYHYLISDIPAEKRLLMMLQTKLKSLDANTSSNQKNSSSMLQSDDFDNKYGDKVVAEYLDENPDENKAMLEPYKADAENFGLANKAAAKSALLNSDTQEKFFTEVINRYNSYIDYLKEVDQYDLEVQTLNLEVQEKSEKLIKSGKTTASVFGADTYLKKAEANVLTKPFTREELYSRVMAELDGKTPGEYQQALKDGLSTFYEARTVEKVKEVQDAFAEKRQNPTQTVEYKKLKSESPDLDKAGLIAAFDRKMQDKEEAKIRSVKADLVEKEEDVRRYFSDLYPGKTLAFKQTEGAPEVLGVFVGFSINENNRNPYAPSAIKANVAFTDNKRQIGFNLSGESGNMIADMLRRAKWKSIPSEILDVQMPDGLTGQDRRLWSAWNELIKASSNDRELRYIVSGNLLQGMGWVVDKGSVRGLLVNYTLKGGGEDKGILLSADFRPGEDADTDRIQVPIRVAWKTVLSLTPGSQLNAHNVDLYLQKGRNNDTIRLSVDKTKKRGGRFFQNPQLLEVLPEQFEMFSDRMVATFPANEEMVKKVTTTLSKLFDLEVALSEAQFEQIKDMVKDQDAPALDTTDIEPEWSADPEEAPAPEPEPAEDKSKKVKVAKAKAKAQKQRLRLLTLSGGQQNPGKVAGPAFAQETLFEDA